jgi:catechol 2,3-dioxygenase
MSAVSQHTPAGGQATLPETLALGPVYLRVSDLDRAVTFYQDRLGLTVLRHDDAQVSLGAGEQTALVLVAVPNAQPAGRHAGLYHVALLYPSRLELARAAQRLLLSRTPIQGTADHRSHEAIYIADPDGNGLELTADWPRELWPDPNGPGGYSGGPPQALDTEGLLALAADEPVPARAAPGLRVGHVHLHVGDVEQGIAFYCGLLGFELQANLGTAAFVSAAGYHHHLAFNVWRGPGVGPAPPDAVGLDHWTVLLDQAGQVAEVRARLDAAGVPVDEEPSGFLVRDPWGNAVRFGLA